LACLGLYGVMAYAVVCRTREIGIRMALGARAGNVQWLVLRETLLLALIGIALGLPAALISTRLTKELLFGLSPNDPLTIALATLVMIAIAALAGYLPAQHAAQVDPLIALRHEYRATGFPSRKIYALSTTTRIPGSALQFVSARAA